MVGRKTGVWFACILLVLTISFTIVSAAQLDFRSDLTKQDYKNYGKCVVDSAKQEIACFKENNLGLKTCMKNARNISSGNRTIYKESYKTCLANYKKGFTECKDNFKKTKEACLTIKCDYNNPKKDYISKSPSECKELDFQCDDGQEFSDSCGCGCKIKKNDTNMKNDTKNDTKIKCEDYRYSGCPENCYKKCVSSSCTINGICTADCEGVGSCYSENPSEKSCDTLLKNVKDEYKKVQECTSDSDCIIGTIGLTCSVEMCGSVYNKNYDLTKIKQLSEEYNNKTCREFCPMVACIDTSRMKAVCSDNKCKMVSIEQNYCSPESRNASACAAVYQPVCGWFNPGKIQCFKYPCAATYSNSCAACMDQKVWYWTDGECPK